MIKATKNQVINNAHGLWRIMVWSEGVGGLQQRGSPNVMASLLPPNSAHVMIHVIQVFCLHTRTANQLDVANCPIVSSK